MISGSRRDRGSITPIMMVVVASTMISMSFTARLGQEVAEASRLEAVAGAVALALATGNGDVGDLVASANGVRILDTRILGDVMVGFDATVTVADETGHGRARASTQDHGRARASTQDHGRVEAATPGAPTIPVSGMSVLR